MSSYVVVHSERAVYLHMKCGAKFCVYFPYLLITEWDPEEENYLMANLSDEDADQVISLAKKELYGKNL